MNKNSVLWTEKYRPSTMDDYVFKNEALKKKMQEWITSGEIPHIGFFGPAGTGKTSAINVLLNGLVDGGFVNRADIVTMNMSDKGIDAVREEIDAVASTTPWGNYRVFVLEEMEQMSMKSQGSMKRIMEDYVDNARFILTSNEPHKIILPIRSRVQAIQIEKHDKDKFFNRIVDILLAEGVTLETEEELNAVQKYINSTFPDFRKTLNTLQSIIVDGKLVELDESVSNSTGYRQEIIDALQAGTIRQMREKIVQNITEDEIDSFFTFLYQNVDKFTIDDVKKMRIYICIRDGAVKSTLVADREMNLSAVLCEIDLICSGDI